jgi:hypothetical protein
MDRVYTFDMEAYNWTNPVAIGMGNEKRGEYQEFTGSDCITQFVNEIMRRKYRNVRFVAHNGGEYDFIPVIENIVNRRDKLECEIQILTKGANDNPFYVQITDSNGKNRYLQDSMALMPRGLDSLTESFTPDFRKGDFKYDSIDKWEVMEPAKRREMMDYLERDVKSLYRVLKEFTDILMNLTDGNCPPQLTVGSTAMTAYRTHFMPDIEIQDCYYPDREQNPEQKFRHSYFGGRTEVYKQYGENLNHYDVNSLYPYCYTEKPIPTGNVTHTGKDFPLSNDDIGGVVKISGFVPENASNGIPVLPYRDDGEKTGSERVLFPAGYIEGWYMAKEVRYAKEVGAITDLEIKDSYASSYGYPFKEYGEALYDLKKNIDKEQNPAKYKVVKFLLNSFYGKFGMDRTHKSVEIGPVTAEFQEGKEMINSELADKGVMMVEDESFAPYILPRIASAITAQARIEMHKWFMKVFDRGGSIYYCDTDSIVTDIELPEGEALGEMDLEGQLDQAVFLAPKVYAEKYQEAGETLVKAKGMRNIECDFDTFKEAYETSNPDLIGSEWEGPRGFKAGMKMGEESWFETNQYSRSLKQFDQKRRHGSNTSQPVVLE